MISVAKGRAESLSLSFNQFSLTADGCQLTYNIARRALGDVKLLKKCVLTHLSGYGHTSLLF